jgi:hypothetical protein
MDRRSAVVVVVIAVAALVVAAILFAASDDTSNLAAPSTTQPPAGVPSTTAETTDTSAPPSSTTSTPQAVETTTPTAADTPSPTLAPGTNACSPYRSITTAGVVSSPDLVEASGMAASRTKPGVVWAHNDSRDGARVYAIGPNGEDLGAFEIAGASAFDWEDMAAGPGADAATSVLYFGDIGDNFAIRSGRITVYRAPEPDPGTLSGSIEGAVALEFSYPDGTHNAEALFVADDSIYIVTKDPEEARIYRGSTTGADSDVEMLELLTVVSLGGEVSGADMSWDGGTIAFRGYDAVWMWHREPGATIAETLAGEPCNAPSPDEVQGEAIAFLADNAYSTVSEGATPDLHVIPYEP